jgi:DNA-binding CsgD family transcriptional regulator
LCRGFKSLLRYQRSPKSAPDTLTPALHRFRELENKSFPQRSAAGPRRLATPRAAYPNSLWPDRSARERELLQITFAGHPTMAIAQRLGITVGTAKNHRRRI